ncbi:MAG TPA: glycosyl hydrolase family 65 protein, partial [Candidatus Limiplasma sp.]|nr:glycosyl hydrolase family 65 protein [Candidatus Limiplasma sp.]
GEPLSFIKWCVYTDSRRHDAPLPEAVALAETCSEIPIQTWHARQQEILDELWNTARITVTGQPSLQSGIDFAIYSLFQSAGRDGISSIASKGLSGEGYEGHYFWDTEIYMFPFFLLTQPKIARMLLDYRYATLDGAREQARLLGHSRGALYPWRTITGTECSAYFPSGSAQYHINSDIAHAVITYYFVTGDLEYMRKKGAEILIETSRLWLDTGHWYNGQFRIDGVTGPDEYTCLVNNNYYTNLSVQYQLRNTLLICDALEQADPSFRVEAHFGLTEVEKESFRQASDKMFLPYDDKLGIYAQDDSFLQKEKLEVSDLPQGALPLLLHFHPLAFYRRQICKQADAVLGHFLYEDGIAEDVIRRTYEYYEPITTHDSSLSPCVFSMMAARIGEPEKAYTYYMHTAHMDMENKQRNTDDGIHAANMGGTYMGIVFGFAGLRIHADGLSLRPCIPTAIESYAFAILYHSKCIRLLVSHRQITLRLDSAGTVDITVYGSPYTLSEKPIVIPLQQSR